MKPIEVPRIVSQDEIDRNKKKIRYEKLFELTIAFVNNLKTNDPVFYAIKALEDIEKYIGVNEKS